MLSTETKLATVGAWTAYDVLGYSPVGGGNFYVYLVRAGTVEVIVRHTPEAGYASAHLGATPCCMEEFRNNDGNYFCSSCARVLPWLVGTLHNVALGGTYESHRAGFESWCEVNHDVLTASLMAIDLHCLILEVMERGKG